MTEARLDRPSIFDTMVNWFGVPARVVIGALTLLICTDLALLFVDNEPVRAGAVFLCFGELAVIFWLKKFQKIQFGALSWNKTNVSAPWLILWLPQFIFLVRELNSNAEWTSATTWLTYASLFLWCATVIVAFFKSTKF